MLNDFGEDPEVDHNIAAYPGFLGTLVRRLCVVILLGATLLTASAGHTAAQEVATDVDSYLDLPLADLLNIEITSVAKKRQSLTDAASAIYVISAEDIRRSAATSVPELLRMVPGLHVAQINQHQWSVSARGFAGLWSNKLLVIQDGRSIYTPFFGGVYWDAQDILLDNIERIEVIRGPGGTLWGANAVNGVINIITKRAADTQGNMVLGRYGSEERGTLGFRHGGEAGNDWQYRIYAKTTRRDDSRQISGANAHDGSRLGHVGFRLDGKTSSSDSWTFQGDIYNGENRTITPVSSLSFPYSSQLEDIEQLSGGNLLARWQHRFGEDSVSTLQVYYDRTERDSMLLTDNLDTFDLDFHHLFKPSPGQELIWGLGYRAIRDRTVGSFSASVDPADRDDQVLSAFIQDEITLQPQHYKLILGSKIEYNDYTGSEWQPSARLIWTPNEQNTVWGAVSNAIRTPSRFESDSQLQSVIVPIPPTPVVLNVNGSDTLLAENLTAYELGFRSQLQSDLGIDVAVFYHDYRDILGLLPATAACQPSGNPLPPCDPGDSQYQITTSFASNLDGESYGMELAFDWQASDNWQIKGSYTYLQLQLHSRIGAASDELAEGLSPHHQFSLRSNWDLSHNTEFDLWLRYVDNLPAAAIPAYLTLDSRIAWLPRRGLELSLIGRNLLDPHHTEYYDVQTGGLPQNEVERSIHAQLRLEY